MGATMATRISHGSNTTRAAVCRRATMAATRGVLLGGVRYIGMGGQALGSQRRKCGMMMLVK
jgi:hypothetical protein